MISAIVLAAGESKRMGAPNKLLLPFGEKTLIEQMVDHVLQAEVQEVILVLGHEAERVRDVLANRPIQFVQNADYQEGRTTSIQAGMLAIAAETNGVMICLSDLPFIQSEELNALIAAFETVYETNTKSIVLPTFQGQQGHPVIFSVYYQSQILAHKGVHGCRGVIEQNSDQIVTLEMRTANVLKDIDTKEDYEKFVQPPLDFEL